MGRRLEIEDLNDFVMVSNPQISPDLGKIAFTVAKSDDESDNYSTTIWIVNRFNGEPMGFLGGKKINIRDGRPTGDRYCFSPRMD